jgi:hypothetical protein
LYACVACLFHAAHCAAQASSVGIEAAMNSAEETGGAPINPLAALEARPPVQRELKAQIDALELLDRSRRDFEAGGDALGVLRRLRTP